MLSGSNCGDVANAMNGNDDQHRPPGGNGATSQYRVKNAEIRCNDKNNCVRLLYQPITQSEAESLTLLQSLKRTSDT